MEGKPYSHNTVKANSFRAGQIFFWFSSKKLSGIKYSSWQTKPSLKDLARQGLISFTKHKRPISSEDLEVLYAANQLGLNPPESFANSAWFNTILYFGKRGCENQREMKPGALQLNNNNNNNNNNNKPAIKYFISSEKATKISPPSSAPDFTLSVIHG